MNLSCRFNHSNQLWGWLHLICMMIYKRKISFNLEWLRLIFTSKVARFAELERVHQKILKHISCSNVREEVTEQNEFILAANAAETERGGFCKNKRNQSRGSRCSSEVRWFASYSPASWQKRLSRVFISLLDFTS